MGAQRSKQTLPITNDFHLISRACHDFFQFPSNDSYKFSPFADLLLVEVDPHVKETKSLNH